MGRGIEREVQDRGDICILMAVTSLLAVSEAHTLLPAMYAWGHQGVTVRGILGVSHSPQHLLCESWKVLEILPLLT